MREGERQKNFGYLTPSLSHCLLIGLLTLITILGCGYHFKCGSHLKSLNINNIYIELFRNNTEVPGLEHTLTNALVYEFNTDKETSVTGKEQAQGVLTGEIISYEVYTVAYRRGDYTAAGRIVLRVRAELRRKGNVVWKNELTDQEEYIVSNDLIQTEKHRDEALRRIIQRMAERIHDGISLGF